VAGVGQQREGIREDTAGQLDKHEHAGQNEDPP
jgi:hypothetical protein